MPDVLMLAGALLVAGPAIGTICLSYPSFWRVWTVPREEHLALVAAHRLAWTMVNVGFTAATVLTAGGLVVLAGSWTLPMDRRRCSSPDRSLMPSRAPCGAPDRRSAPG